MFVRDVLAVVAPWSPTDSRNTESAGIRTQDLRIKSALLYLLSYTPKALLLKHL